MWTRQHRQRNTGRLIIPAIAAVFLSYFGFHAVHGEYGMQAKVDLEAQTADLQKSLDKVRGQREALERKVRLLQDGTIEKDMLDEQARRSLNLADPAELIILRQRTVD